MREGAQSLLGSLLQYPKDGQDGEGMKREEVVQIDEGRTMMGMVEGGIVSWTLGLHWPKCLNVWTRIGQEKGLVEWALLASILPRKSWRLQIDLSTRRAWTRNGTSIHELRLPLLLLYREAIQEL